MKENKVLSFSSLTDLAVYVKVIQPKGYTINTVRLTLTASLTPFELSIALENHQAVELKKMPV